MSRRGCRITERGGDVYCLVLFDENGQEVETDTNPQVLARKAFDLYLADEVKHDYDLVRAAQWVPPSSP